MAKVFTNKELESIRASVTSVCALRGIKPMIDSPYGKIVNPQFSDCVSKEYNKAISEGNQGRLSLWLDKANSFIKASGGLSGAAQTFANLSNAYKEGYDKGISGNFSQQGDIQTFEGNFDENENKSWGNLWLWLLVIILLLVLIIFSIWYFNKSAKN